MKQKIKIPVDGVLQYLSVWNGIFNLTPMELKVLSAFIVTDDLLGSDDLCCYSNKKATALSLGISDPNTLNNYVKKLKDKGAIIVNKKRYELNRLLNTNNTNIEIAIEWS
jgi:hypothetical protein